MSDHSNKCVFILVITFIVILIFLIHVSIDSVNDMTRMTQSEAKQQKAAHKSVHPVSEFGSSSTIDAIYGNQTDQDDFEKVAQNKTVLKRMIVRQPSFGRRLSTLITDKQTSGQTSAPISSIPFELRSFLLRRQHQRPQQSVRPFNGFTSKSNNSKKIEKTLPSDDKQKDISIPRLLREISFSGKIPIQPINQLFNENNLTDNKNSFPAALEDEEFFDIRVGPAGALLPIGLQYKPESANKNYPGNYRRVNFKLKSGHKEFDKKLAPNLPIVHEQYKGRRLTSDHYYQQISKYPETKTRFREKFVVDFNSDHRNSSPDIEKHRLVELYERERPSPYKHLVKKNLNANNAQFISGQQLYPLSTSESQTLFTPGLSKNSHNKNKLAKSKFNFKMISDNFINRLKFFK